MSVSAKSKVKVRHCFSSEAVRLPRNPHSAVYPGHHTWSLATRTVTKMQISTRGCDKENAEEVGEQGRYGEVDRRTSKSYDSVIP